MVPVLLNRTIAAKLVNAVAGPLDKPAMPSIFELFGVASNSAENPELCDAIDEFCHVPALAIHPAGVLPPEPVAPEPEDAGGPLGLPVLPDPAVVPKESAAAMFVNRTWESS